MFLYGNKEQRGSNEAHTSFSSNIIHTDINITLFISIVQNFDTDRIQRNNVSEASACMPCQNQWDA